MTKDFNNFCFYKVIIFWVLLAFLSGPLPFSAWIGALALHTDIRTIGDGNPGASNGGRPGARYGGYGRLCWISPRGLYR